MLDFINIYRLYFCLTIDTKVVAHMKTVDVYSDNKKEFFE